MNIFEAKNITKRFPGVLALNSVNLTLEKGEIHALIGENGSGKSTLMKTILGIYHSDEGEMLFKGKPYRPKGPADALNSGICMIHQEISLVPTMSVAENIWLGRENLFMKAGLISRNERREKTQELLNNLNIDLSPDDLVKNLSVARKQMVEIARAASYNADITIMDEPTSALTEKEVEILYDIMRTLKLQDKTIVFITHKIDEIFAISDRVTVLRDGNYIDTVGLENLTNDKLVSMIIGRDLSDMYVKNPTKKGEIVLEVKNLCNGKYFQNVSFDVRAGEILGVSGLMGAGRTEVMRAVFGIDHYESGEIYLNGKKVKFKSPKDAIHSGLGMVTEDRLNQGIVANLSLVVNMSLANLFRMLRAGLFVNKGLEQKKCNELMESMNIKATGLKQHIDTLSGGNQQKVLIARCLMTEPQVIIFDEPTRGIDVGAKSEIYKHINDLAEQGIAVIMISSEMSEILALSDRIMVMSDGKVAGEFDRKEATQEKLMTAAFGLG